MANVKISQLTALTPPDAADLVPVTDSSASQTKRTTVGEIVGIVNGDVDVANDGTATISELPVSKLQDGAARQLLQTDAAGTGVEWTSNVDVPGTLDVAGATTLDSTLDVDGQSTLASAAISDLTSGRVVLAGASGELEDNAGLTFNGTQLDVDGNVVITGDLTVEGASTTFETETVKVEDKNIELGVVASPTDVTADGGGITLKGSTDKTINWIDATDAWTFSEHINIASAKEYRIAGTKVLDATSLGSAVVSSSLTSVGTITTGVWQGTAINATYLDSTVVTTSDTGTVTSTMLADGTIVDADVNAAAAINGAKINPNFGSQNTSTTGTATAAALIPSSGSVPSNGLYLPSANTVGIAANSTEQLFITSDRYIRLASGTAGIQFNGDTATANALDDYEEGTWTLTVSDAASGGNTSTTSTCLYTKVGRIVTVRGSIFTISTAGLTAGNTIYFQGLPFTPDTNNACGSVIVENITFTGYVVATASPGTTAFRLAYSTSGAGEAYVLVSDVSTGADLVAFEMTYNV